MTVTARHPSVQLALFAAVGLTLPGCIFYPDKPGDSGDTNTTGTETLCEDPESVLGSDGQPLGYERCADGSLNRTEVATLDPTIPGDTCAGTESDLSCTVDADCTSGTYGRCLSGDRSGYYGYDSGIDNTYCGCVYSCTVDADCGPGKACITPELVNTGYDYAICKSVDCNTNDDCASGECALTSFHDGCSYLVNLTCRDTDVDDCRTDDDCADSAEGNYCAPHYSDDNYVCQEESCAIGRPLLVGGVARKATDACRSDWTEAAGVSVSGLNRKARRALAKHWSGVAAMEHASVASFARFSLQLMALGAPPELLLETQAAAADEVRHAQITFGIASEYTGAPVGPGPLDLSGVTTDTDLISVLRGLILEACVGETLGVAEAIAAADACEDPAIEAALRQIAADETRHSALAWKTLKWMLDANPALASIAAEAFDEAVADMLSRELTGPEGLDAYGVLSPERRMAVYREAAETLVRPCARQLLDSPPGLAVSRGSAYS